MLPFVQPDPGRFSPLEMKHWTPSRPPALLPPSLITTFMHFINSDELETHLKIREREIAAHPDL